MARRYDTRTTTFSPEGRLYQVEYAMEAISHAGTCLGVLAKDGVVLAAENRTVHKLLDDTVFNEKIYKLYDDMACSVAGITSDANVLINLLRSHAQRYKFQYKEEIPCEQLVQYVCNYKQAYTQTGGKRPYGVSILYMGWDPRFNYQLYQSDPSGNYSGWKATCIGNNSQTAISMLKQDYKEDMSLNDALKLCMKVLSKTLDVKLSAEKIEVATLIRKDEQTMIKILGKQELGRLVEEHEAREKEREQEEQAKQQRQQQQRDK